MKKSIAILALSAILIPFSGCRSGKGTAAADDNLQPVVKNIGGNSTMYPRATIFTMSGDYADKVAVTFNPDGTLAYFPDPMDITANSAPYSLGNGWYLNRQGVAPNSVFTKWTFNEYRALPSPPSPEEIKAAVIPGARVTDFEQIPVSISDALANPGDCIKYVPALER